MEKLPNLKASLAAVAATGKLAVERLFNHRASLVLAGTGALALAASGCGSSANSAGRHNFLNCQDGPKTNAFLIKHFEKGSSFHLGQDTQINSDGSVVLDGDDPKGFLHVKSAGNGDFNNTSSLDDTDVSSTYAVPQDSPSVNYTYSFKDGVVSSTIQDPFDHNIEYSLMGSPNQDGSTALVVNGSCKL